MATEVRLPGGCSACWVIAGIVRAARRRFCGMPCSCWHRCVPPSCCSQVHLLIGTVGSSYSQTARLMGDPFFVSVGVEYENKL